MSWLTFRQFSICDKISVSQIHVVVCKDLKYFVEVTKSVGIDSSSALPCMMIGGYFVSDSRDVWRALV